ncbi:MAG: polysaccharide pyruvyl transferase family protein [Sulfurovum sp.]|nr:polysaccharide pyruvyl transferase family protein [Sulfurovum sp.]
MKIGILTLPIAENYGGILQAVALYRLLHMQGHKVTLIYKSPYQVWWKKLAIEILSKIPFQDYRKIKSNYKIKKEWKKRKKFHRPFIENEIFKISKDLYTKKELENFVKKENFDAVIVGSDQVWRKRYIDDSYYKSYFLDFVDSEKTKKIAYAASFGKDQWEGEGDSKDIAKLLKDFTAVSTREASSVNICKSSFGYADAVHVLDPTLLMDKAFYIDEIIAKYDTSNIPKGGLVTYVLDEAKEKKEIIEFVKKDAELESVHHLKGFNSSHITYSVPQWLSAFANADFVVTDSFHGMVFSMIFEKGFVVIGNHDRGLDRFTSLLSLLGLEDRLIFSGDDLKAKNLDKIDYICVNKILEENKKSSMEFLMGALDDK